MTPEERFERIERQTEFVLSQQAQFYADLQRIDERIDRVSEEMRNGFRELNDLVNRITHILEEVLRTQAQTAEQLRETDKMFRRHISDGHGGQSESH